MRFHYAILFVSIILALFVMSCSGVTYPSIPQNNVPDSDWPAIVEGSFSVGVAGAVVIFDVATRNRITVTFTNITDDDGNILTAANVSLTNIVASFTTNPADATVWVGLSRQISGVTVNDFSDGKRKTFIVRASDGSLNEYRVGIYNESDIPDESGEGGDPNSPGDPNEPGSRLAFPGADFTGSPGSKVVRGAAQGYVGGAARTSDFAQYFKGGFDDSGTCLRLQNVNGANVTGNGTLFVSEQKFYPPNGRTLLSFWIRGTAVPSGTVSIIFGMSNTRSLANPGFTLNSSTTRYTPGTGSWSYQGSGINLPEWTQMFIDLSSASDEFVIEETYFQIRGGVTGDSSVIRNYDLYFDEVLYEESEPGDGEDGASSQGPVVDPELTPVDRLLITEWCDYGTTAPCDFIELRNFHTGPIVINNSLQLHYGDNRYITLATYGTQGNDTTAPVFASLPAAGVEIASGEIILIVKSNTDFWTSTTSSAIIGFKNTTKNTKFFTATITGGSATYLINAAADRLHTAPAWFSYGEDIWGKTPSSGMPANISVRLVDTFVYGVDSTENSTKWTAGNTATATPGTWGP